MGIGIIAIEVRHKDDIESAFAKMVHLGAHGAVAVPSTMLVDSRALVSAAAARYGIPALYTDRSFVEAGGLLAYGPDFRAAFRQAATYVAKILHGATPGELPIEQPTRFELVINARTARTLGLTIPPSILARADEVIE